MIPTCPPDTYPAGTVSVRMPQLLPAAKSSNTEDGNGGQDTFRAVKYSAVPGFLSYSEAVERDEIATGVPTTHIRPRTSPASQYREHLNIGQPLRNAAQYNPRISLLT
jgi:hypothetical protein